MKSLQAKATTLVGEFVECFNARAARSCLASLVVNRRLAASDRRIWILNDTYFRLRLGKSQLAVRRVCEHLRERVALS